MLPTAQEDLGLKIVNLLLVLITSLALPLATLLLVITHS